MNNLRLYLQYISIYLKTVMEYRFAFFTAQGITALVYTISFLGVWIVLTRFTEVNGWTFYEILLLYNLNLFSYGMSSLFFRKPMRDLEIMVQEGTFDSILIYPMNPFFNLICRQFDHGFLAHVGLSGLFFLICFDNLPVVWRMSNVAWFAIILIGATMIQASIMILSGSMSFWFVRSSSVVDTAIYGLRRFVNYPLDIYDRWVQVLLTFVIPYGFVAFYPADAFLAKGSSPMFHGLTLFAPIFQYGTPLVGCIGFVAAYRTWMYGLKKYESTGS